MTRLELIMSDAHRPLGPDDVEALLRRLERPKAPADMLSKVRARLAATEGTTEGAAPDGAAPTVVEPPVVEAASPSAPIASGPAPVVDLEERRAARWRRFAVEGLALAAAAAALVIAVQVGERVPQGGNPAAEAAGIGAEDTSVVDVRLHARGLDPAVIRRLGAEAGLTLEAGLEGVAVSGGANDVRRFLVSLRVEAARAGVEVNGFIPDAGRLRITVVTE